MTIALDAEQRLQLLQQFKATVRLAVRRMQLCKAIADVVVGIEVVKSGFQFSEDRLAVGDQQLEEFLVLFDVVWHTARHIGRPSRCGCLLLALLKFVNVRLAQ